MAQPLAADRVTLLDGAAEAWPRMLAAIAAARQRVHFEIYALYDDAVGRRFIDALGDAAARGVGVEVVVDAWGSLGAARRVAGALRRRGCDARVFNRLPLGVLGRLGRNHRKLLVVDGAVAFVGGINVGQRYADWADLAVEIRGGAAASLARRIGGEARVEQRGPVRVHLSRRRGGRRLARRYVKAIAGARRRVVIAHAYFLPEARLVRALARAARRGVDVRLLVPEKSDVAGARLATAVVYAPLLRAGVRIFAFPRAMMHAKAAVVDGRRLLVGSFNLDPLSLANLEVLVVADDPAVAAAGERWIDARIAVARELGPPAPGRLVWSRLVGRALAWVARSLAWLLR